MELDPVATQDGGEPPCYERRPCGAWRLKPRDLSALALASKPAGRRRLLARAFMPGIADARAGYQHGPLSLSLAWNAAIASIRDIIQQPEAVSTGRRCSRPRWRKGSFVDGARRRSPCATRPRRSPPWMCPVSRPEPPPEISLKRCMHPDRGAPSRPPSPEIDRYGQNQLFALRIRDPRPVECLLWKLDGNSAPRTSAFGGASSPIPPCQGPLLCAPGNRRWLC